MIVTTGNEVDGRGIAKYLGVVRGVVVRSPTIGQGLMGGLKQIVGGNIEAYARGCARPPAKMPMTGWCLMQPRWAQTPSSGCATTPRSSCRDRPRCWPTGRPCGWPRSSTD